MSLMEVESFLNQTEDTKRSLTDPWELKDVEFEPEVLLDTIMLKAGECAPLYSNVATFYSMNRSWWRKWQMTFQKWWEVIDDEYEPLWDRNGTETIEDHIDEKGTLDTSTSSKEVMDDDTTKKATTKEITDDDTTFSENGSSDGNGTTTQNSTTTNTVSGYDSSSYSPHDKSVVDASGTTTQHESYNKSGSGTDDKTVDTTYNETGTDDRTITNTGTIDTDTTGSKDFTRQRKETGNWGISTTSQKLLESELRVRYIGNLYEHMSDIFCDEMLIRVYL